MPEPLLIAHRGESYDAPENTLAAINLAWSRGAHAVELDVRLSADRDAMVIHDANTQRIGGAPLSVRAQSTVRLRTFDAGRWKSSRWAGERIPLLVEVLERVPEYGRLFVELKEGPESVAPVLAACLGCARVRADQLLFMCFRQETVAELVRRCEANAFRAALCLLLEKKTWRDPVGLRQAIDFAHAHRLNALNLEVSRALDRTLIERLHGENLQVFCWTVNRPATARRLFRAGIDGVTTDRCAWMREQLENEFA